MEGLCYDVGQILQLKREESKDKGQEGKEPKSTK